MELLSYGPFLSRKQAQEQGTKWYYTGKPCKHGHISDRQVVNQRCRMCGAMKNAQNCKRWYEEQGRDQVMTAAKDWVKRNPERRKEIANKHAKKIRTNPETNARKNKMRREGNRNELFKQRFQEDLQFRFLCLLKGRIQSAFKLQCGKKAHKTAKLLGLPLNEFKNWIASQFTDEMSWDNYAYETWHLDHIRPCSSFDLTNPAQQLVCFNWRNQRPLDASENMSKNDAWTPQMESDWVEHMNMLGWDGDLFLTFEPATMAA